ncbi:uncharacterized protein FIBRA_04335 [Fibroporia radiculosa]|uniref:Uncharacterized protein n=1 Tax=Fibroporia radiculosa TaxID=599839 RepID=J4HWH1_9APHY|nr:uncharacterized protein FIBRA_04335 [Fibroporia radiculosa]CCM02252.1 predicted protein [Fibroporia radiculosa]
MFAQYSPLFTSGLLSGRNSPEEPLPSSSRSDSFQQPTKKQFHDSLPLTVSTASFHAAVRTPNGVEDNALLLTFVPRRRTEEGRSFLSLDLAESQSMRSMSLRRKDTVTTRATTCAVGRSEPSSPAASSPPRLRELVFSQFAVSPTELKPHADTRLRRPSREALRLPSAKPAPLASLPEPPRLLHRRRASNLTLTLSACLSTAASARSPVSPGHRASHSAPSVISPCLSPMLSPEQSYFLFSPVSPLSPSSPSAPVASTSRVNAVAPSPPHSAPAAVPLRATPSFRSVASANTRQRNRSAALAVLEGRSRSHSKPRPRNFMSMSDDEDDLDEEPRLGQNSRLLEVLQEDEDIVIPFPREVAPAPKRESPSGTARSSSSGASSKRLSKERRRRSRRGTLESLLQPLANFIEFKDDDRSSRGWRSFVEISS